MFYQNTSNIIHQLNVVLWEHFGLMDVENEKHVATARWPPKPPNPHVHCGLITPSVLLKSHINSSVIAEFLTKCDSFAFFPEDNERLHSGFPIYKDGELGRTLPFV